MNRATFYLRYGTKDELLVASLTEIFDELVIQIEARAEGKPPWESMVHAQVLFEHVDEKFALYQAVLGQHGLGYVMHRILTYIAAHEEQELRAYFGDAAATPLPIPIQRVDNADTARRANMDPKHRDRIAFFRVCSGRYQSGMKVRHVRLGREIKWPMP